MSLVTKKKKKVPFIYKLFSIILSVVTIALISSIISLNVLNLPLLLLVLFFILGISGLSILFMLKSRVKKIGFSLFILLIILYGILIFFISKTTGFFNNLDLSYKTYNYSVLVRNNNNYNDLNDIDELDIGYYDDGSFEINKALKKVLNKVDLSEIGYPDTHTLADALLNGEVTAILIENSYLDILNESVIYNGVSFKDNINEIYDFTITTSTSDIAKDIDVVKEPFNIYVSGIDTYGEISSVSRSDVNMVLSVNPDTRQILLTSIPRDYYVQLHGKSGYRDKLTHAGLYGTDMSIETIEDFLNIEINYYVKVNFSSVINIVDVIGGINVYSDYTFTSMDNYDYIKGYNKVDGEKALSFARERKAFASGDRQRVKNQQAVFRAIFDKCMNKGIITRYTKLLDSLEGSFVTNMPMSRITSLIKMQLTNNYSWNIVTNSLEGSDSSNYTYSAPKYKAYVMIPDKESVIYASDLIDKVIDGNILDESLNKDNGSQVVFKDNKGLEVKLIRSCVTINKGEEYIYHGYLATYDGEDITKDSKLEETFSINGRTFDDYRELVRYVTYNLDCGSYIITYKISYKDESKVLKQEVVVKDLE